MKQNLSIFFFLVLVLFSCKKEKIDTDLQIYVDQFFIEAEKRNINLKRRKLEVVFNDTLKYCGVGYKDFQGKGTRRVEINMSLPCWNEKSELQREILLFHELGHAILERGHKNKRLPNRMFASIMAEDDIQHGLYTEYSLELRDYYIDELFNPAEPVPEWAELKTNKRILLLEDFEEPTEEWIFSVYPESTKNSILGEIQLNQEGDSKVAKITALEDLDTNDGFYSWSLVLEPPDLFIGGSLQLNAKIKTKDLKRLNGAEITVITESWTTDSTNTSLVFGLIDRQNTPVWDNTEGKHTVQIGYYPSSVKRIAIHLHKLGPIRGEVEFDDIELVYYE